MENPSSSSSSEKSSTKAKASNDSNTGLGLLNEDLLQIILTRLPALSFASAACVSKTWNSVSNRVLSRPKLSSALSLNPSLNDAVNEVLDKVLSEPIRPHFALANIANGFESSKTMRLIRKRLGFNIPVVVNETNGIIGRDALTDEFKEVNWHILFSGIDSEGNALKVNEAILLTVGYLPGLKVEAIPLRRPPKTPQEPWIDNFVMDIKEYSASVSNCQFPVGIILFGKESSDMKLVLEKLDYAMPMDTVIVGDECGAYRSRIRDTEVIALVFAQDRDRSSGSIRFHIALSNGVSTLGARYKAVSVKTNFDDCSTWLTARREGQQELLDGHSIILEIKDSLENLEFPELCIGVIKHRKFSIGADKPMSRTSIAYHGVIEDEEYLHVYGIGIKTGDIFQFCYPDPNAALASLAEVHDGLNSIKLEKKFRRFKCDGDNGVNVFGGLIFASWGRGGSRHNVDSISSPFLENFPGVPLGGIFCRGEMGRPCTTLIGQHEGASPISFCLYFSTVYLVMSYAPPSVEQ